ncbi:MAG: peptidoglycan-binding protein [Synechococcales bacterium]|nr:peptidoglycan-binding protein [Synechococcales bacterium]
MLTRTLFSMGLASVLGFAPIVATAPGAEAQVVDGDIAEEEYSGLQLPLVQGDRGPVIRDIQLYLQEEGYAVGPIDGIYGPLTQQAVVQYQIDNDLQTDGVIGSETFEDMADSGLIDEAGETFNDVGNEVDDTVDDAGDAIDNTVDDAGDAIDNTVDDAGDAIDNTVDDAGDAIDNTVDDAERVDDGLFDQDGVLDDSTEDDGVFDNEGQFDNEDDGIL